MNTEEELYKASLPAFFENEKETDKSLLWLSVIGIIAISISAAGVSIASVLALGGYYLTGVIILCIFYYNKKQFLRIMKGRGETKELLPLIWLDKVKYLTFAVGLIATLFSY